MFGYLSMGFAGFSLFLSGMPVLGGLALIGATVWLATTGVDDDEE